MKEIYAQMIAELQGGIFPLEDQIRPVLDQINAKKKLINQLCAQAGADAMYPEVEGERKPVSTIAIRSDQYFGRPLATVVREILEPRKGTLGAMPLDELFEQLKRGGYQFDNKNEMIAKRNVAITLGKNSTFMKVPNTGAWGLAEWYPGAKKNRAEPTEKTSAGELPGASDESKSADDAEPLNNGSSDTGDESGALGSPVQL